MKAIVKINRKGINAVAVKNSTAIRQAVINNRIEDATMAATKAMMIELLKTKMANGVAHFAFLKKDGSVREAWGTIQANVASAMTNGRGESRENYATTAFYSITDSAWRSFRWENLLWVA